MNILINMNYRKIYLQIIKKAKSENRKKYKGIYYEKHHILPKILFPLWSKRKSNLVLLTAREHFFCHQLLEKIYPGEKMFLALWRLANDKQNKYLIKNSKEYEKLKIKFSEFLSKLHKGISRGKGISKNKGIKHSDESKKNMSKGHSGYGWWTNGIIETQSLNQPNGFWKGRIFKHKDKSKYATMSGKIWWTNGNKNIIDFKCPQGFWKGRTVPKLSTQHKENIKKGMKLHFS